MSIEVDNILETKESDRKILVSRNKKGQDIA